MADRNPSKQKRARENRAQREALAARTAAASAPRPSRAAPAASGDGATSGRPRRGRDVATGTPATSRTTPKTGAKAGTAGATRPVRERPIRPGDVPVDIDTLEGPFYKKVMYVPGGRQVFTGAVLGIIGCIASVITAFILEVVPLAEPTKAKTGGIGKLGFTLRFATVADYYGAARAVFGPAIALIVFVAVLALSLHPRHRRIWYIGTFVALISSVQVIGQFQLACLIGSMFLGYGVFRASRVEGRATPMFGPKRPRTAAADDDGVVETTGSETDED